MEVKRNSEEENEDSTGLTLPNGSEQPPKRGRGRPVKKTPKPVKPVTTPGKRGRPRKVDSDTSKLVKSPGTDRKRGRPPKVIKMRGRPRKTPLTPEEEDERKKTKSKPKEPRVWKPLGRPRIYPREEPPVSPSTSEPRGRGRPRKVQSKQGAHLRKNPPLSATPQSPAPDSTPRKRGRPPGSFKNSPAKKAKNNSEQKSSPPPAKRSRQSSDEVDEPQEEKSTNEEEDTGDSQGDRAETRDASESEAESIPIVSQRRRGRPRGTAGQAAQEHEGEEEKAARKTGSGKKAASKKTAAGKQSKNEMTGRENISSIL